MSANSALLPLNDHNLELQKQVHPTDWVNPKPAGKYNLVVIGGGTAGLVSAAGAAGLGAKVALIERELLGGDCLNVGCVPSKGVISAARAMAAIRDAAEFHVSVEGQPKIDFAAAMQRMRKIRADISHHDSAKRFTSLGVDVFLGSGSFVDDSTIEVGGERLSFSKAVIATGAKAAVPEIPGIHEVEVLTNETLFSLTELPRKMIVIGGGPIGAEMAQSFARFGSQVTLIDRAANVLSREDRDAAQVVQKSMERDGVKLVLNAKVIRFEKRGTEKVAVVDQNGVTTEYIGNEILVSIGRSPNVKGMGLENAGVQYDPQQGVTVNDKLQTSNRRIYAAGDVCSKYKFTHAADFMARTVLRNALFMGRSKVSKLVIPWCTYTSPELAHIGLTAEQANANGIDVETFEEQFSRVDRALLEGETEGFVRVHVRRGTDKIVGATIVARNAGDMIGELSLAMTYGIGLGKIASAIHPYPTQAEAIRKVGDQYNRTKLTPLVKKAFNTWLRWTR